MGGHGSGVPQGISDGGSGVPQRVGGDSVDGVAGGVGVSNGSSGGVSGVGEVGGGGGDLVGLVSDNGGLSNVVGLDGQLVVDDGVGAGVSGHDGGGRVGGNGLGVDMGLVDNLLDGVDLVGGLDVDGTGNVIGDGVGDVLVDNDGALNGDGDVDGDINVVLVDLSNGDDVGLLGSDPGVGPHGGEGLGDGDGIGRGGSSWDGCGGTHNVRFSPTPSNAGAMRWPRRWRPKQYLRPSHNSTDVLC